MRRPHLLTGTLLAMLTASGCQQNTQTTRAPPAEPAAERTVALMTEVAAKPEIALKSPTKTADGFVMLTSPQVPFSMTASTRGEVLPGVVVLLSFTLAPSIPVDTVQTTVRSLKGVVVSGGLNLQHGRVQAGAKLRHTVHVKAPAGVAGYVVVDVAWTGASGSGSTTAGVEIRAKGASQKLEKLGTIETDSKGNRVEVMKAEMR